MQASRLRDALPVNEKPGQYLYKQNCKRTLWLSVPGPFGWAPIQNKRPERMPEPLVQSPPDDQFGLVACSIVRRITAAAFALAAQAALLLVSIKSADTPSQMLAKLRMKVAVDPHGWGSGGSSLG